MGKKGSKGVTAKGSWMGVEAGETSDFSHSLQVPVRFDFERSFENDLKLNYSRTLTARRSQHLSWTSPRSYLFY